jgi:CHAD domain-containing protein
MLISSERGQFVFQKLERDLRKLVNQQHAESVHSFRTTTRRLQTLLVELLPHRDRNQKKLLKELDEIRRRAGKVRDLDVQLAALRSLKVPQEPRRKTQLMQGLIELRAKHEKKLRKLLTQETMREIHRRLKRAGDAVNFKKSRDPLTVARQLLGQAPPAGELSDDVLHRYRILVKRARYAAEFAPKSPESTQLIAQLKRLQDAIGNWHDWLTLTNTAAGQLGDVHQSPLVAALHNVTGGKFRTATAALEASPKIESRKLGSQKLDSQKLESQKNEPQKTSSKKQSAGKVVPATSRSRKQETKTPRAETAA